MTIFSPLQNDFLQIIDDIGLPIVIREVTRTVDADGRVSNVATTDTTVNAIVDEIDDKKVDLLESGYYNIGDVRFHIVPQTSVKIFDKVVWNSIVYGVKQIHLPQRIVGNYPYIELHCVRDSEVV